MNLWCVVCTFFSVSSRQKSKWSN